MKRGHTHAGRRQFWKDTVAAWRASGLTKKAFCREHNISYYSLLRWCKRVEPERDDSRGRSLVEVSLSGQREAQPETGPEIEIVLGETRVRVPEGTSQGHVETVLSALRGRSC